MREWSAGAAVSAVVRLAQTSHGYLMESQRILLSVLNKSVEEHHRGRLAEGSNERPNKRA